MGIKLIAFLFPSQQLSATICICFTIPNRRCPIENSEIDTNVPLFYRRTEHCSNHSKFIRHFSEKGTSKCCKSALFYGIIHTMNDRLSQEV